MNRVYMSAISLAFIVLSLSVSAGQKQEVRVPGLVRFEKIIMLQPERQIQYFQEVRDLLDKIEAMQKVRLRSKRRAGLGFFEEANAADQPDVTGCLDGQNISSLGPDGKCIKVHSVTINGHKFDCGKQTVCNPLVSGLQFGKNETTLNDKGEVYTIAYDRTLKDRNPFCVDGDDTTKTCNQVVKKLGQAQQKYLPLMMQDFGLINDYNKFADNGIRSLCNGHRSLSESDCQSVLGDLEGIQRAYDSAGIIRHAPSTTN